MSDTILPVHPRTGLRAVGIVGGRPVWPIMGGAENDDDQGGGKNGSKDGDRGGDDDDVVDWKARAAEQEREAEKWKTQSRKHEDRAKSNAEKAKELEKLKESQLGDNDKAIAQARAEERAKVRGEYGGRLVAAEVRVQAANRMSSDAVDALIEMIDPARFLNDDGEVDTDTVRAHVEKLAPARDDGDSEQQHGKNGSNGSARGGTDMGQGRTRQRQDGTSGGGVAAGRARYESRAAARTTTSS